MRPRLQELAGERDRLAAELEALQRLVEERGGERQRFERLIAWARSEAERVETLSTEARRAILLELDVSVRVFANGAPERYIVEIGKRRPAPDFFAGIDWSNVGPPSAADRRETERRCAEAAHRGFESDVIGAVLNGPGSVSGTHLFIKGPDGNLVPDPDSAVGVMEAFYAERPDFGRGGFFAVLPFNCFAEPNEPDQMPFCERKLTWLAEHGYEVGNHTAGHQDLLDVTDERFMSEIAEAARWIDERVPEPGNLSRVLIMPYGNYPDADLHPEQRRMMREGFEYDGMYIRLQGAFMVGSNPAESPSSALWDPIWIPRIQTFEESMEYWFTAFEDGNAILYVSDGNLDTVTVPDPLPPLLVEELDPDLISESGKELIQYGPEAQASTD